MEKRRKQEVDWESLYNKTKKNLWHPKPHSYSTRAFKIIKKGRVLDLGAGEGHDSVYFGKKGFQVTSIDISKTAIQKIRARAGKANLKLMYLVRDINSFPIKKPYEIIVSYGTLQFLGPKFTSYLTNLKSRTTLGGVHAFYLFGDQGDFYDLAKRRFHFPSKGELKKLYKDWHIISLEEKNTRLLVRDDKGKLLYNNMFKILAQKPL